MTQEMKQMQAQMQWTNGLSKLAATLLLAASSAPGDGTILPALTYVRDELTEGINRLTLVAGPSLVR